MAITRKRVKTRGNLQNCGAQHHAQRYAPCGRSMTGCPVSVNFLVFLTRFEGP